MLDRVFIWIFKILRKIIDIVKLIIKIFREWEDIIESFEDECLRSVEDVVVVCFK